MKMAERFLACAAAVLLSLPLVSCHGAKKTDEFSVPDSFDESRQYEITFWAKNDTNKVQSQIYEKAIADFTALYPNITVNMRLYTDYGRIYNDVITNISTGTTPNVCITYPDHIATYLTGEGTVVNLDTLMDDKKYGLGGSEVRFDSPGKDEIVPQFLDECNISGAHYALPFMRSTEACYINKTFVEALGYTLPEKLTWDFVWEVSNAAAEKDENGVYKVNGQKVMIPFIYKSTDNMMIQSLRQLGGDYSDEYGNILIFNDDTKAVLRRVAEEVRLGAFSTFKISSYPANFLNAGQCVFAIDSTAGATWMGPHAPLLDISEDKLVDFEIAVMPIPQYDTENPYMISQGPSMCIFNKEDEGEVLASWLFMQYLLTNEVQIAYSCTEGYVPVTLKAQQSAEYVDYLSREGEDGSDHYSVKIKAAKILIDNVKSTFTTPVFSGSASLRDAAGQMIENTAKSVKRGEEVNEEYYDSLFESVSALYRLDQVGGGSGRKTLGALPGTAVVLLSSLGAAWAFIIIYFVIAKIRKKI